MVYRKNVEKKSPEPKRIIFYRGMYNYKTNFSRSRALMAV